MSQTIDYIQDLKNYISEEMLKQYKKDKSDQISTLVVVSIIGTVLVACSFIEFPSGALVILFPAFPFCLASGITIANLVKLKKKWKQMCMPEKCMESVYGLIIRDITNLSANEKDAKAIETGGFVARQAMGGLVGGLIGAAVDGMAQKVRQNGMQSIPRYSLYAAVYPVRLNVLIGTYSSYSEAEMMAQTLQSVCHQAKIGKYDDKMYSQYLNTEYKKLHR